MPKSPLRTAAAIGGTADDIEAAFYEALQRGDIDALMACWADEDEVFCVHPGGPRLVGTAAIRSAFEQMFGNGAIHATPAHVRKIDSIASAVHNVLERIEVLTVEGPRHAFVLATNLVLGLRLPDWRGLAGAAYVGVFEMGLTFALWLTALKLTTSTARVANLIFLSPLVSLLLIHVLVGEAILASTYWGLGLILLGQAVQRLAPTRV